MVRLYQATATFAADFVGQSIARVISKIVLSGSVAVGRAFAEAGRQAVKSALVPRVVRVTTDIRYVRCKAPA